MKPALIDTDTVSYFFRSNAAVVAKLDAYLQEFGTINLSVITFYEILNGLYFKDAKSQLAKFEQFAELNQILPLTQEIAQKAASIYAVLRSQGQPIGHNDVLIAATAIVHNLTLITNNINHFSRIKGLDIDNWS